MSMRYKPGQCRFMGSDTIGIPLVDTGTVESVITTRADDDAVDEVTHAVQVDDNASLLCGEIHGSAKAKEKEKGKVKAATKTRTIKNFLADLTAGDLTETFIRGSGNGGQKVNKTSSAVYLV